MALAAIPNRGRSVRRYPLKSGETFVEGAPVLLGATGEVEECGADPAVILGFAAHDAVLSELDPDPGYCLVYAAVPGSTFWVSGDNAPVAADVGDSHDLSVDADGVAYTDGSTSAATRFVVETVDLTRSLYEVSIKAANRQIGS